MRRTRPQSPHLIATVNRIVQESGRPENFDASTWLAAWLDQTHPAIGGQTPRTLLAKPDGEHQVERILLQMQPGTYAWRKHHVDRMRGNGINALDAYWVLVASTGRTPSGSRAGHCAATRQCRCSAVTIGRAGGQLLRERSGIGQPTPTGDRERAGGQRLIPCDGHSHCSRSAGQPSFKQL